MNSSEFIWSEMSKFGQKLRFLYPTTLKSAGYYVLPSIQKMCSSVCPSACMSVCMSVCHFLSAGSIFEPIFFKLAMRVDIGKECPGIADW